MTPLPNLQSLFRQQSTSALGVTKPLAGAMSSAAMSLLEQSALAGQGAQIGCLPRLGGRRADLAHDEVLIAQTHVHLCNVTEEHGAHGRNRPGVDFSRWALPTERQMHRAHRQRAFGT